VLPLLTLNCLGSPTKNKTDELPLFKCKNLRFFIYTIFFVVNCHNTCEYTFFISKIIRENAALFSVGSVHASTKKLYFNCTFGKCFLYINFKFFIEKNNFIMFPENLKRFKHIKWFRNFWTNRFILRLNCHPNHLNSLYYFKKLR